jgi:outer membrane protein OmpA-like peptidoglycan-associated protein
MSQAQPSTLHLQMGQEVIYLLLVTSLICNVLLAAIAMRSSSRFAELRNQHLSDSEWVAKAKHLEDERSERLLQVKELKASVQQLEGERSQLIARVEDLEASLKQSSAQQPRPEDQPPIITLREADGFSFNPGSAEITPAFLARLAQEVVPKLSALGERYGAQIVEIIGHTDGTSITDRLRVKANLDDFLGQYLDPSSTVAVFPYDNVGLGISRAVSVARALRASGLPSKFDIQPLSAAYLIAPNDRTAPAPPRIDDPTRRRIEIRIRRVNANRSE